MTPYLLEIENFLTQDTDNLIQAVESLSLSAEPQAFLEIMCAIPTVRIWLSDTAKRVWQSDDPQSQRIVAAIKCRMRSLEQVQRDYEVQNPQSEEEFAVALYWFAEHGTDRELMILNRVQRKFPPESDRFRLCQKTHRRIEERIPATQPLSEPPPAVYTPLAHPRNEFKIWQKVLARINRRWDLEHPLSLDDFINALRWAFENGDVEELDLIRRIRVHPPYDSDKIQRLLDLAEDQIHDRVYDPQRVVDREEAAYQQHQQEWDEQYKGEFIAIHRGQVIDHDANKRRLIQRLDQKQREEGRFRAYIVQIGAPLYVARGPAMGRRVTQTKE